MGLTYGSVCSGIEAATVAWSGLGWKPAFFSEIEAFPRAVLQHHYPDVPLHGDFTTIQDGQYEPIDLLCGGTPCQSFSIAGLRGGLEDERGNLSLEFIWLAKRLRPRWVVWENVPGVFSALSHDAPDICPPPPPLDMECDGQEMDTGDEYEAEELHAFQCFVAGLQECGYGVAYRVFDAQYFGVPQRRRRVVVVGYLGDWRPPAAVLFEPDCLRGDITPRREARKEVAGAITSGAFSGGAGGRPEGAAAGHFIAENSWPAQVAPTLNAAFGSKQGLEDQHALGGAGLFVPAQVTHTLRATWDGSEDGTGRGVPLVPYAFKTEMSDPEYGIDVCPTLQAQNSHSVVYEATHDVAGTMMSYAKSGGDSNRIDNAASGYMAINPFSMGVRRLTPRECERLQGFPDDYSLVPYRKKPAADGPRYKALGNSWAVPKFRWVGERIQMVEGML